MIFGIISYAVAFFTIYVSVLYLLLFLKNRHKIFEKPPEIKELPFVSLIIPAYNEEKRLSQTLDSVLELDYPREKLEIIVVDDGSKDKTLEVARRYEKKGVIVFSKENGGKAAAMNYAIARAKGEIIATMDADSYPSKDCLKKMVNYFSDEETFAVTSVVKVHNPRNVLQKIQRIEYLLIIFGRKLMSFIDCVYVTPGPMSLFRKKVFKKLGGFDEKSILEDQEYALRIQSANLRIQSSMDAVIYTEVPETFSKLVSQRVRWNRGGLRNLWKYRKIIFNPDYGDLGMFFYPLALISVIVLAVLILLSLRPFFEGSNSLDLLKYGPIVFYLGITPEQVVFAIIGVISVVWTIISLFHFKEEKFTPFYLFLYLFIYIPLTLVFWLVTIYKELRFEKLKW